MRKQMQEYLDTVLGTHKALVSVHAELNYNQVHSMATTYTKGAVLSSDETDEDYKNGATAAPPAIPAGINGNTGTPPQYAQAPATGKTGDYENTGTTTNYDPDKTETETQEAPGGIQRLAVAVLIDSAVPATEVDSIRTYLSTLAGVATGDPSRVVTVQSIPFSNADATNQLALMKAMQAQARQEEFIKIGAVALAAIILLIIFLKSSKGGRMVAVQHAIESNPQQAGRLSGTGASADHMLDEPMSIEELLGDMPTPERAPVPRVKPIIPEIEEHMDVKLESVRDMVNHHPQSVALLIKGWISDESDIGGH